MYSRKQLENMTRKELIDLFRTFANQQGWDVAKQDTFRVSKLKKSELVDLMVDLYVDEGSLVDYDPATNPRHKKPATGIHLKEVVDDRDMEFEQYREEAQIVKQFRQAVLDGQYDARLAETAIASYAALKGYADHGLAEQALLKRIGD